MPSGLVPRKQVVASKNNVAVDSWAERSTHWMQQANSNRTQRRGPIRSRRPPLILSGHGVRLSVDHGTLLIQNGFSHFPQQREESRLLPGKWRLPSRIVILDGSGSLSLDAIAWLAECDIPVVRIDWRGDVIHVTGGSGAIDPTLRDAQLAAANNGRGLALSRHLVAEKIANCMDTLRHAFPSSPAIKLALSRIELDAELIRRRPPASIPDLLGIEGHVAVAYFGAWQSFPLRWKANGRHPIPDDWKRIGSRSSMLAGKHSRNRYATHPMNALLNYAYGMLEHQVRMHLVGAGFDPTIGYLHGSYREKHALVYDLMEPLRPILDCELLKFVQRYTFESSDFTLMTDGVCRVNPQLARCVVSVMPAELGSRVLVLIRGG